LPSGKVLVAHSGMHGCRDNPACAALRMRGPTPPGRYGLKPRPGLFYGDRALTLEPRDPAQMHGRDGILAHSYLGMRGNSLGCVSFERYRDFLASFVRGEIDEIEVVPGDYRRGNVNDRDPGSDRRTTFLRRHRAPERSRRRGR